MLVLLTGATGFVGGHVAERLTAAGHGVRALTRGTSDGGVLDRCGAERVRGSLEDEASLRAAADGTDAVIHVAGLIKGRPSELHAVNADGTARLLAAVLAAPRPPRRFVHVSSLAAQGPSPDGRPLPEDAPARPVSHYGASKLRGERIAAAHGDRLEVAIVRPPAVYGPRDRETLEFFKAAAAGIRLRFGPPDMALSLVHVEDLADGIVAALERPEAAGGTFHLCHAEPLTLGGVMDAMAVAVGRPGRAVTVPRPVVGAAAFVMDHVASLFGRLADLSRDKARELTARAWTADPGAARRRLGWSARIPLAEGAPRTATWYREAGWLT